MRNVSLRALVSTIGLFVALTTAILIPAGYFAVGYLNAASLLDLKAELNARYLAKYIYTHDTLWQYQRVRLAELLEQTNGGQYSRKRVVDSGGRLVLEEGADLQSPTLTRGTSIVVAGTAVGRVEVEVSLRDHLYVTGIVALFSFLLGMGMYFVLRTFPLRVLDQTLGTLERINRRFDAALSNMSQGLIMFDRDERISVCNDRYIKMYNLSPEVVKPGCTLSELFAHRVEQGHLLRDPNEYRAELLSGIADGSMANHIVETADGREIAVSNKPIQNGGWISTHEDVTEQRAAQAKIAYMAHHDALTSLPNRTYFRDRLQGQLARLRAGQKFAVLCLDLDRFKAVNDTLGHLYGDSLLRQVAMRLRGCLREGDNADLALYRAKADRRGSYRFFEHEMDALMQERRKLELNLRQALASDEFELYYQPLINLAKEEVSGFEALLRWHHPQRGLVLPLEFIPLAEETGLIVPIGEWVIRTACEEAAKWPKNISLAVNLSAVQFKSPALAQLVIGALATSGLSAQRLELEITESVLLANIEPTLVTLHQLRNIGVRISMDDFGTGYSSLSYLRRFPFDKIKIDRSFVREIGSDKDSTAIVRVVASLGASLGMSTTGEGVETQAELDFLKQEGCTEAQGFFFSDPRPAKQIYQMLAEGTLNAAAVA